jgi:hypothetical protein
MFQQLQHTQLAMQEQLHQQQEQISHQATLIEQQREAIAQHEQAVASFRSTAALSIALPLASESPPPQKKRKVVKLLLDDLLKKELGDLVREEFNEGSVEKMSEVLEGRITKLVELKCANDLSALPTVLEAALQSVCTSFSISTTNPTGQHQTLRQARKLHSENR